MLGFSIARITHSPYYYHCGDRLEKRSQIKMKVIPYFSLTTSSCRSVPELKSSNQAIYSDTMSNSTMYRPGS